MKFLYKSRTMNSPSALRTLMFILSAAICGTCPSSRANEGSGDQGWTRHYTLSSDPAISVTFSPPASAWADGFSGADITITNTGSALSKWTLVFRSSWGQSGFWNAGTWNAATGLHTITNPAWSGYTFATGASITIGFNGVGTWSAPTEVIFNDRPVGIPPAVPAHVTYQSWRSSNALAAASNPDADGDAIPDLAEFLFGSDPKNHDASTAFIRPALRELSVGGVTSTYYSAEVDVSELAEGIEYRMESSTDLASWTAGPSSFVIHSNVSEGGRIKALWRSSAPLAANPPKTFVRLAAREVPIGAGAGTGTGTGTVTPTGPPNSPVLSVLKDWRDNIGHSLAWNIYGGQPAESWKLYQNGTLVHTGNLTGVPPQTGSWDFNEATVGAFTYTVELINSVGSVMSSPFTYVSDGASRIGLSVDGTGGQAIQTSLNQGNNTINLSGGTPPYTATVNHPAVLSASVSGNVLTLQGIKAGRSGLKITDAAGNVRLIGARIRESNGDLPGFPDYLALGSVSEDAVEDLDFWAAFDPGTRKNRWVDFRYIYINGGVKRKGTGWRTWTSVDGDRMRKFVRESIKLGMIPTIVYYNIPDGGESYTTDLEHMQDEDYMRGYYEDLQFALDIANQEAPDSPILWIMEPDFIGYMAQNSHDPTTLMAQTNAAYDVGVLKTTGTSPDPLFPDTMRGMIESINYTIKKHSPVSKIAWQFNLWAFPPGGWNANSKVGVNGLIRITDTAGMTAGRQIVWDEGTSVADYYMSCGILSHGAELVSIDKYGLDGGAEQKNSDPSQSTWFWNAEHWGNYLHYINALRTRTGKKVCVWQLPVGRINSSQLPNPYNGGLFPDLPNTPRYWEDSSASFFLGDTFIPGAGARYSWFSANSGGHTSVTLGADGSTIIWGSHMTAARNAGVDVMLFGDGVGNSTNGRGYNNTDSFWWITAAQKYYENPVPLNE